MPRVPRAAAFSMKMLLPAGTGAKNACRMANDGTTGVASGDRAVLMVVRRILLSDSAEMASEAELLTMWAATCCCRSRTRRMQGLRSRRLVLSRKHCFHLAKGSVRQHARCCRALQALP